MCITKYDRVCVWTLISHRETRSEVGIFERKCWACERKLNNEELHNLPSTPNIIWTESRRIFDMHRGNKNAYKILVGEPQEKSPFGRPKLRCKDSIKMLLICDLNNLVQGLVTCFVSTVMNIQVA
jgi:hypothetical protein